MTATSSALAHDVASLRYASPGSGRADTVTGDQITRFDRAERYLHWANATLVLTLIATGSILYVDILTSLIGRRLLVQTIHLWAGLALPFPFLAVVAGRSRRSFRRDARRLGRFGPDDWRWLCPKYRRGGQIRVGKFNAGQKLNAVLVAGSLPVMLLTGALMQWHDPFQDSWRTGATFVHDIGYVGLVLLVAGHIRKAFADPMSMEGMKRGAVTLRWAREHHPRWHAELLGIDDHVVPPAEPPVPTDPIVPSDDPTLGEALGDQTGSS